MLYKGSTLKALRAAIAQYVLMATTVLISLITPLVYMHGQCSLLVIVVTHLFDAFIQYRMGVVSYTRIMMRFLMLINVPMSPLTFARVSLALKEGAVASWGQGPPHSANCRH